MKKIISLVLALLMLLTCIPALAETFPAEGYDGSEVTIKFRHVITKDDQLALVNDAIAEFNKIYPNIHVELENVGGSYNGILDTSKTELPAGNEPNIVFCYMDHIADYNNQAGAVQVLDELIDHPVVGLTEEQKADFIPGYYKEGASFGDGKMYALPFYKSTEVLYYNKTFFDENNLTVPATWDEMEAVCARLEALISGINLTNSRTLSDGTSLTALLARRDMLKQRLSLMRSFLDNASATVDRYSRSEIVIKSTVPVAKLQKQIDDLSKELRELDEKIQELNWTTDLIE